MTPVLLLGIAVLGGAGAVLRVLLDRAVTARSPRGFPYGILAVNLAGTFALGAVLGAAVGDDALRLVATSLLASFTTFSTWMLDSRRVAGGAAAANLGLSLLLGLAAAWGGRELAAVL